MLKNLLYLLILWSNIVVSQSVLKGRIIDGETKLPLDKANVFVSNTTYIAITDVNGRFIIHVPQNNYQLAVSYVGYGAVVVKSSQLGVNQSNIIELFPETGSIKPVSIISSEKRNNYLRMFRNAVLGTSANAKHARILNINDVFLEISDEGCLVATSDVPLEIENPGLNYKLSFLLKEFKIDMSTETSMYSGYLSF
ncbi:MAG TPA: carboxypeptidase-like regulatory domain-containing protein, partial [Flavobacterium sp.]